MEQIEVVLLSRATNEVVIQLPGRRFPGSVIQGDSLGILYQLACKIAERTRQSQDGELQDLVVELRDLLDARLQSYTAALNQHGLPLPF